MALWTYERDDDGSISRKPLHEYDHVILEKAKQKYELLKNKGVILSAYNDQKWTLSKQTRLTHIDFGKEKQSLQELCQKANESYENYVDSLKCFVLLRLGTCQIETMTTFVSTTISETIRSNFFVLRKPIKVSTPLAVAVDYCDFVKLIAPSKTSYHKACEKSIEIIRNRKAISKKRHEKAYSLCEFDSVFVYDELIRAWRDSEKDHHRLAYFYPLYLFWIITTVLPLRVNEFCYTPYNCIFRNGNRFYLTVRRSKLKGNQSYFPKIREYTLDRDYELKTYEIPEQVYNEIETYKTWSKDFHRNYELLFSLDYMYENDVFQRKKQFSKTSVFDNYYLGWLQKTFYQHIIVKECGYRIVTAKELDERSNIDVISYSLSENEIMMIMPKETRHLAMINLVLRGCNPVMIKEFAGHADESTSAHYYTNGSNLTRTAVMRLHEQQLHHENSSRFEINAATMLIDPSSKSITVDCGKCYSPRFLSGDYSDCSNCSGECRNCRWCIPDRKDSTSELESIVNDEFEYIAKLLKNPNIDKILTQIVMQKYYKLETNLASRIIQEVKYEQK